MVTRKKRREEARARSRKRADKARKKRKEDIKSGAFVKSVDKDTTATARQAGREAPKPKEEKKTIQLNPPIGKDPETGVITLNQPQPEPTTRDKVVGVAKAVGVGAAIGTGAFLIGGAIAGTSAAAITATAAKSVVGLTKLTGKAGNIIPGKFVTIPNIAPAAINFATNTKTVGLTSSFLIKAGLAASAAGLLIGIISSYPFSGFIKEESLQTLSFAVRTAMDSGDLEGAQDAIDQINEILNPQVWDKILAAVPFLNVHTQLKDFYLAATTKNANDQEALDKARKVQSGEEESDFAKSRRISDEAARERQLGFREEDEEFFQEKREEAELRDREREEEEEEKFDRIAQEREARDEEDRALSAEDNLFFEGIRNRNLGRPVTPEQARVMKERGASIT